MFANTNLNFGFALASNNCAIFASAADGGFLVFIFSNSNHERNLSKFFFL